MSCSGAVNTTASVIRFFSDEVLDRHSIPNSEIIKNHTPNFAISIADGIVNITPNIDNVKTNLFSMKRTRIPSKETAYSFNYTNIKPNRIEKCLNQMPIEQSYFWRYAKEMLMVYRGTKLNYLYMYLKEIEFRYNNRHQNIFEEIVAKIANFEGWR